jgi:5-methylcytosine-specific restriction endonuclease McrA
VECERLGLPHDPHAVLEVDHIDGDVTNCALSNLRTLCRPHHSARTARDQAFGRRLKGRTR